MATKSIKTRIQNKHAVEADWVNAVNFVPLAGELIIYDPDDKHSEPRIKVGDGVLQADGVTVKGTKVNDLPFIDANLVATIQAEFDSKISSGTADPTTETVGKYYFKYSN